MIPKCHMYKYGAVLCVGQYQASVVRVVDGVVLLRRIDLGSLHLGLRHLVVDLFMHLRQERRGRRRKPSPTTQLE